MEDGKWQTTEGSGAQRSAHPTLFHAGQAGVANQMLFQIRVDRALAAQPGEGVFGLLTQMNLLDGPPLLGPLPRRRRGRCLWFNADLDEVRARSDAGIHAAGGDQFGLGDLVGGKDFEDGDEVLVGEVVRLATEQTADVALGQATRPCEFALIQAAAFGQALEGGAEITHRGLE